MYPPANATGNECRNSPRRSVFITNPEYNKKARYYLKLKRRNERIFEGPETRNLQNILAFKNKHKNVFIRKGRAYAREKIQFDFPEYLSRFKKKNIKVFKDMGIVGLRII